MLSVYKYRPEFDLMSDGGLSLNDKFKAVAQIEVIGKDSSKIRVKINHVLIKDKQRSPSV